MLPSNSFLAEHADGITITMMVYVTNYALNIYIKRLHFINFKLKGRTKQCAVDLRLDIKFGLLYEIYLVVDKCILRWKCR